MIVKKIYLLIHDNEKAYFWLRLLQKPGACRCEKSQMQKNKID